ncbi:MAG: RNA polymerase sigma factor [Candidatus Dormibacteraceae bacterium]
MGATGDPDLIARARDGNKAAFEDLLSPVIAPAARLAYGMLQDRAAAEDAVQEAALKAWQRVGNVRPGAPFRPWFLGIVVNQARSMRRTKWWSVLPLESSPPVGASGEVDPRGHDVRRALLRVPSDQRAAILLHFYLDLPLDEVAGALGISVAGVKSRINRGLKRMRPALRGYEVLV